MLTDAEYRFKCNFVKENEIKMIREYTENLNKQFIREDYEDHEETKKLLVFERPVNLHAACLLA